MDIGFKARKCVYQVKSKLADSDEYRRFGYILGQSCCGFITFSEAFSTIQNLLQNHHDLLRGFDYFDPANHSPAVAAAAACRDQDNLEACVDFFKRVKTVSTSDDGVYEELLDFLNGCATGEATGPETYGHVVELLEGYEDLVGVFKSMVPESCRQRKRPSRKKHLISIDMDFDEEEKNFEDQLCSIDVMIGNLRSAYMAVAKAVSVECGRPKTAFLSEEYLSQLNIACIRNYLGVRLRSNGIVMGDAPKIMRRLRVKTERMKNKRQRMVQKYRKFRGQDCQ